MNKFENPSVIAFERKLSNSDAIMHACTWDSREKNELCVPIHLQHKSIRGTISNRLKGQKSSDPLRLNAEIQKPNLQSIDIASLPFDKDTLKLTFSLRILGDFFVPSACNNPEYQKALYDKILAYVEEYGCRELALRYSENLANGRFLWRNRVGAEAVEIKVSWIENQSIKKSWVFNSYDFNLRRFLEEKNESVSELAEVIQNGLIGKSFIFLKVEAFARLGFGQEVFPSQELIQDKAKNKNNFEKSKILYHVKEVAAMHSQKIGNALRTIDTWHPSVEEIGPIAIEPYGSVTSRGSAYRQPPKDFYSLLDNWMLKDKTPEVEQQHYIVACLIRGGVFSDNEKKAKG